MGEMLRLGLLGLKPRFLSGLNWRPFVAQDQLKPSIRQNESLPVGLSFHCLAQTDGIYFGVVWNPAEEWTPGTQAGVTVSIILQFCNRGCGQCE